MFTFSTLTEELGLLLPLPWLLYLLVELGLATGLLKIVSFIVNAAVTFFSCWIGLIGDLTSIRRI